MKEIIIGSRGSKLALWQSEWVKARLEALDAEVRVRIEIFKTQGDVRTDVPLSAIGGQGAFTKELEVALLDRRVDVAVHSLKDLPTVTPEGLAIAATPEREDPRDALVLRSGSGTKADSLKGLAEGAVVGTSSLRRVAQLKHLRPDVRVKDLRGNVDTRLRKLDAGEYDALILASAGLRRLGFGGRISAAIEQAEMLSAVGQGSLGIETRSDDEEANALVSRLDDPRTRAAVVAERALLRSLGGGCQVPIAAHATVEGGRLKIQGLVAALDGSRVLRESLEGDAGEAVRAGEELAARLLDRGAGELLRESNAQVPRADGRGQI
ncbi:MAG TPA: hydroxymethylbilane synthase [Pyrinomonadaceae bacterium]|nr:hydroxymethylbilane synthase [Pyrinomonadaceae bacterium]